jgi:hypothetical protein
MFRYNRCLKERIYLLSALKKSDTKWNFEIRGQTLNIYNQELTPNSFYCSCPDHETRNSFCKHLLFLVAKVGEEHTLAKNLCVYQQLWDVNTFEIIIESFLIRLKSRLNENDKKEEKLNTNDVSKGDCSICFEKMCGNEKLINCETTCKNWFHYDCISKWLATLNKNNCPLCRSIIMINESNDNFIDKNVKTNFSIT